MPTDSHTSSWYDASLTQRKLPYLVYKYLFSAVHWSALPNTIFLSTIWKEYFSHINFRKHKRTDRKSRRKLVDSKGVCWWRIARRIADFWILFIFRYSTKLEITTFRKLALFPSSGKRVTFTLLGPLERANRNHFSKDALFSQVFEIRDTGQIPKFSNSEKS
jgi:hypothetical protein